MVRVAIVEDETQAAETLRDYLNKFETTISESFQITHFPDAASFLAPYLGFDLVFMDIMMPGENGMDCAAKMRQKDPCAKLIFVTNMASYAVSGYQVNALDFILKPVSYSNFAFRMKRAMEAILTDRQKNLLISVSSGIERIRSADILYVEIQGHKLIYHLTDRTIETRQTMSDAQKQLSSFHFLRCNNCYLVNPSHIEWVHGYSVKVGTDELLISHPRKKQFMEKLGDWYSKGGI